LFKNNPKTFFGFIERFINNVDSFNNLSAIGTLEFVDNFSKYFKIDTICNPQNMSIQTKNMYDVIFNYYQNKNKNTTTSVGGGDMIENDMKYKYTKKRRVLKNNTKTLKKGK
jgi:hypothetical protein